MSEGVKWTWRRTARALEVFGLRSQFVATAMGLVSSWLDASLGFEFWGMGRGSQALVQDAKYDGRRNIAGPTQRTK